MYYVFKQRKTKEMFKIGKCSTKPEKKIKPKTYTYNIVRNQYYYGRKNQKKILEFLNTINF